MSDATITARAQKGVLSLLGRQAITFPINILVGVLLARLLTPADFGTYATVSLLVMGTGVLLDVGLGAIVVQQAEEPTPELLRSVFTAQMLIFGAAAAVIMAVARPAAVWFHLTAEGPSLLRVMALSMVIAVFGSNSHLLLERRMRFEIFARLDVVNTLVERVGALALAYLGFGTWSFVIGAVAAVCVRVAMLFAAAPWRLGWRLERTLLKRALRFGLAFQGANLTALARDNINALLGGSVFGPKAVGYLNWGMNLAQTCSHSFVMIVGRVSFPAFARLHDAPAERERLLVRTLGGLNLVTWPLLAIAATLGSPIVAHVYGEAWRPALPVLWAFSARFAATNTTSILVSYLNATGRAGASFRITLLWTAVEWGLALALLPKFGFYGIAVACGVGALLPACWLLFGFRSEITFPTARLFLLPLGIAAGAAALAWMLAPLVTTGLNLVGVLALLAASLAGVIAIVERAALKAGYQQLLASRRRPLESRVATADNRE